MKKHKYQQKKASSSNHLIKKYIDLHLHTTWSDGALSVKELLQKCASAYADWPRQYSWVGQNSGQIFQEAIVLKQ